MEHKTYYDWLSELPEPYRVKALSNTKIDKLKSPCANLQNAVGSSFIWKHSPEGTKYWATLYKTL